VTGRGFLCISVSDPHGTVYSEPVGNADAYHRRLKELRASIEDGAWTHPEPLLEVVARRAKAAARRKWHEEHRRHPLIEGAVVAARMALFAMVFVVVGLIGSTNGFDLARAGRLVAAWAAVWFVLTLLALRQRPQH
jgi:hypothetical protein